MGMEDQRLSHHYPCHTDMITFSLSAHKHNILHILKKLKKTIKTCEHWGLYKYLTHAMCKRHDDRMDPFAMDFDDKEENKEMTDNDDFTDMTPKYMFQKFELVLLKYNPNSRKITLVLNNYLEAMTFYGDNFRNMLGLEEANDLSDLTIKFEKDELHSMREYYYEFPKSCSFNYEGAHMYVYSSLVKDSLVGNVFAPIIRVVGLEDKPKSETIHREFTVPHYLPLRSSCSNEVVLELTDGMGNSMKFNQGNSVAVFHFKKKGKI